MKIVIVMTYFDRQIQLDNTLYSFAKTKHDDFEVIIVDDCSLVEPEIGLHDFDISVIKPKKKQWIDGSPAYNMGIIEALKRNPDIIILQNAETYHVGDIISYSKQVTDKTYISYGCFNLSRLNTFQTHSIEDIIRENNNHALNNEDNAWLNHKTIRQMGYHWCSAITADNMRKINGFDERFSDGYCFEDDEFLARVRALGLEVEITDSPFVVHQWHDRNYVPKNWSQLFEVNRTLFDQIRIKKECRAVHKFTHDFNN